MLRKTAAIATASLTLSTTCAALLALFLATGDGRRPAAASERTNETIIYKTSAAPRFAAPAPAACRIGVCQDI